MEFPFELEMTFSWLLLLLLTTSFCANPVLGNERSLYILHMDLSLMPKPFTSNHHWYTSLTSSSTTTNKKNNVIYTYSNVADGFCAYLSKTELESVKASPSFVTSYHDKPISLRTTHTTDFLSLNRNNGLWPASDYGEGVVVGIVDTGVWPESRSFHDNITPVPDKWKGKCEEGEGFNASMCNSKLVCARSFNKGLLSIKPHTNLWLNSARDEDGHGTHCASTAAGGYVDNVDFFGYAEGTARGMAPHARVASYKIYWGVDVTTCDVLAAIDKAVEDGVDVLSLSFGVDTVIPFYENPIAIATFAAMEKGIVVAQAGGNSGPGFSSITDAIPWTITVGAGDTDRRFAGTLKLGNNMTIMGWTTFPLSATIDKLPLLYNETIALCDSVEYINTLPPSTVIICDNTNNWQEQFKIIAKSTIAAAIFVNDDPLLYVFSKFPWPGVAITSNEAISVIEYAKTRNHGSNPIASIKFKETIIGIKPAPKVATYTSRGPAMPYPGILKPDLIAPGTLILAAYTPNRPIAKVGTNINLSSDYVIVSGTSMACPHVAGIAALMRGAHPTWSPAAIQSALMTTANPLDNTNNPIQDNISNDLQYASPLAMGSGHIDPNRALDPGLVYDATARDYVNVLCYLNYTKEQIMTLTRTKRYNCTEPSPDANYPSFIVTYNDKSSSVVSMTFHRTLTNVGLGGASYEAKVVAPEGSKAVVHPTHLVFDKKYDKQSYSLKIEWKNENKRSNVSNGVLIWIEQNGNHTVRSPIVISPEFIA
ncbi:subtilisin-like protease SBT3 [Impatiens glandulifera]|uniref:subtilisin-like protease SBT3 n=1 Tax=Impatiens glandulifera TaxID=253017 RepID=UPI001FB19083|nr:subtilisin-like protease SBT3 [Impatiens glandulifera]